MIIVTGGSGKVGRACVKDLMEHGYKVASIDMARPAGLSNPPKPTDVNFTRADITDFGAVMAAFSGINTRVEEQVTGIVHLGAIASPGEAPDHVIFDVNMISTYNVFEAARRLKIRNVVWASSETVYGIPYPGGPQYVPVDEEIELPQWSYSLSKLLGEKMAEQFARWDDGTKIIGLRFSNVQEPQDYAKFPAYQKDARSRHFNLWTYIDARDAAQAIRLSLESKLTGAHVFGIANNDSVMTQSNDELLDEVFPGTKRKRPLQPHESLISIEKARRVLGYKPEYDWRKAK
ncbi:NAD-dependent epimerase/dehydratase family protein [Taklimakanibacter lacteus]|uniref:NAD-dependent epimerase/dehydratase family protein n=1 Tax=Taklimakanibacter lacteus TaxID=2268456 RepID=UPI000E660D68